MSATKIVAATNISAITAIITRKSIIWNHLPIGPSLYLLSCPVQKVLAGLKKTAHYECDKNRGTAENQRYYRQHCDELQHFNHLL